MKLYYSFILKVATLVVIIMLLTVPSANAQADSYQDLLNRSQIAIAQDGCAVMAVQREVNYLITGNVPVQIRLPIAYANLAEQNDMRISAIILQVEGTDYQYKKNCNILLPGLSDSIPSSSNGIPPEKSRYNFSTIKKHAKMSIETFSLPAGIQKGKTQTLLISAAIIKSNGSKIVIEAKSKLTFRSLPIRSGWYCGDGHMHTTWSDGLDNLDERASYLNNAGMGWAVITDHEKLVRGHFSEYLQAVAAQAKMIKLPLAAGLEITTAKGHGHALAYGLNAPANSVSIPNDAQDTCQALIDHIHGIQPGYSFAVIAHPYSSTIWQDMTLNTGFQAMELASGGAINEAALTEWMRRLRSGQKIEGLGNSDCHLGYPDGMTYLYMPNYSPDSFEPIWQAMHWGRVIVSEKGHLGIMAINGQAIGSTLQVTPGTALAFTLIQQPCSGVTCDKIEVLNENMQAVYEAVNPSVITTFTQAANARFYLCRAYFSDGSKTISNPIYIVPSSTY